jgi:hypothetical protein
MLEIKPDFQSDEDLNFIHRRTGESEIYFIASSAVKATDVVCSFRVTGMIPEAWDPATGQISPITVFKEQDGEIRIPIHMEPSGSLFIVFRSGKVRDSNRITSVTFDGKEFVGFDFKEAQVITQPQTVDAIQNFTIAGWVYPEIEIALPEPENTGANGLSGERNDVVYAAPGHEVWTEKDAGAGLGVGVNGIGVYEHTANYFPALLVYPVEISGWTHVAVVYKDNQPSLFVNGILAKEGLKSTRVVHGSLGVKHTRNVKPFIGQIAGLVQLPQALSPKEIEELTKAVPDTAGKKPTWLPLMANPEKL